MHAPNETVLTRRAAIASLGALGFSAAALLAGCAGATDGNGGNSQDTGASGSPSAIDEPSSADGASTSQLVPVRLGTMATEDFLPGWVAEAEGIFEAYSLEAQITVFQSAQELSTAVAAGEIDMAMTDPMVSAALAAGGAPVRLLWVTLGAEPAQGRFGIQVGPDSAIATVDDLRGASIGVGSNTVPEYVMDKLLEAAGIGADDIVKEEVKKVPVRFQMMQSGQTDAAALPASLLALGEATGCVTIVDDSTGQNLSQSVMVAREAFTGEEFPARQSLDGRGASGYASQGLSSDASPSAGLLVIDAVRMAWNQAAQRINDAPEEYRELLVQKAGLSDVVAATYPICTYPVDVAPTEEMVQPVLDWMSRKGYLSRDLTFDEKTGAFEG